MANPNFEQSGNMQSGLSPDQLYREARPSGVPEAAMAERSPVDLAMEKKAREAFARDARVVGQAALRTEPSRQPIDEVIDDLRTPQYAEWYQDAEGLVDEAWQLARGERTLGDVVRDAKTGYYPGEQTWKWEGKDLEMPPARPELPPHSQN